MTGLVGKEEEGGGGGEGGERGGGTGGAGGGGRRRRGTSGRGDTFEKCLLTEPSAVCLPGELNGDPTLQLSVSRAMFEHVVFSSPRAVANSPKLWKQPPSHA